MSINSRSLVSKIQETLDGNRPADQAKSLARDYVSFCQRTNARIKQFSKLIREGNYYAALDIAKIDPPLPKMIERARFPREKEWQAYCVKSSLPTFEGFNDSELKRVKEICADNSMQVPVEYGEYREAMLCKDNSGAILALRKLHEDHPKDLNARQELMRVEKIEFERISKSLEKPLRENDSKRIEAIVGKTLEQPWLIELDSEPWLRSSAFYEKNRQSLLVEKTENLITQLKVIQRVGNWEDGIPLIEEISSEENREAVETLRKETKQELKELKRWFASRQSGQAEEDKADTEIKEFSKRLHIPDLEKGLKTLSKGETKRYLSGLEMEWATLLQKHPKAESLIGERYHRAVNLIQKSKNAPRKSRKKAFVIAAIALPVLILTGFGLFVLWGHQAHISEEANQHRLADDLPKVQLSIQQWDDFQTQFYVRFNPFQNRAAKSEIDEAKEWIHSVNAREKKVDELLAKLEESVSQPMTGSELRRVQTNMQVLQDLTAKLPASLGTDRLPKIASIDIQLKSIRDGLVEKLRSELTAELDTVEALMDRYFDPSKTSFIGVPDEISEVRGAINAIDLKLRQSFETEAVADLSDRQKTAKARLDAFERDYISLNETRAILEDSLAVSEYLSHLNTLAALPFHNHPIVIQAKFVTQNSEKFNTLAQQLLLPGNPIAWKVFTEDPDAPFYADQLQERELAVFESILNQGALQSIYRYRKVEYVDGIAQGNGTFIFTDGEVESTTETQQTSGRIIQKLLEFDEFLIGRGEPFREVVYTCETSSTGIPRNGQFLFPDRLTPESGFFQQIVKLCKYDADSQSLQAPILDVLDTIKADEFINPIFKAYLFQEFFKIMIFRPFDWGLNFSPTAQIEYKNLSSLRGGALYAYDFMRANTNERLYDTLTQLFENLAPMSYHDQALASRELFVQIASQRIRFGGFVKADGEAFLLRNTPTDRKLFGMTIEGQMVPMRNNAEGSYTESFNQSSPFTPLVYFYDPPSVILDRVSRKTGVDTDGEYFQPFLPAIFVD